MADLIDRQAAIEALCNDYCGGHQDCKYYPNCENLKSIEQLPSAQPERKKGQWIDGHCSNCGCDIPAYIIDWKWQKDMDAKFCPNCGADMRGENDGRFNQQAGIMRVCT